MPASTEPRSGLSYGWGQGEANWNLGMDENLLMIGRLVLGGGVLDRDLSEAPTPVAGEAYIVGPSATGEWSGHENEIAVYDGVVTSWVFYQAPDGFGIFIIDEEVWSVYLSGNGWSNGVAHSWA